MSSPETHRINNDVHHKATIDSHLRPLALDVQDILKRQSVPEKGHGNVHSDSKIDKKHNALLAAVLDDSLSPEKRLAAVKALVGKHGHLDVSVRDSKGHVHKLRLGVEKAGSHELIDVTESGGKNGHRSVFLRGTQSADGAFHKQKDNHGHEVSFSADKIGKVEQVKSAEQKTDVQNSAGAKVISANPDTSSTQLLSKMEISGGQNAVGTAYYPCNNALEGGFKDKVGNPLHTLEDYLAGRSPYVSVAMDGKAGFKYGQQLRIPELEQKYGKQIPFKIVDSGGAFVGKGTGRIDICVANEQASHNSTINGNLTLQFV